MSFDGMYRGSNPSIKILDVVQLEEQQIVILEVEGSSPFIHLITWRNR